MSHWSLQYTATYLDFAKEGFIVLEFLFECGNGFGLAYQGDLCSKKSTSITFCHLQERRVKREYTLSASSSLMRCSNSRICSSVSSGSLGCSCCSVGGACCCADIALEKKADVAQAKKTTALLTCRDQESDTRCCDTEGCATAVHDSLFTHTHTLSLSLIYQLHSLPSFTNKLISKLGLHPPTPHILIAFWQNKRHYGVEDRWCHH